MKIVLQILLLCIPMLSLATDEVGYGSIKGAVHTNDGKPAAAVTVLIKSTKKGTTTGDDGVFEFRKIKADTYTLQISLTGYETIEQTVTVEENKTATLSFQLQLSDKQLYEVIVTGGRNKFGRKESNYVARMPLSYIENPQVYNVVNKDLLQEQVNTDFRSGFKNIPGVAANGANHSANGRYFNVSRGFSTANNVRNGLAAASVTEIDPVNLERLEAIKGPSGTLFGGNTLSSFGGLFNRVTKKPTDYFKGEVSYTVGSWGLNRLTLDLNTPLNESKDVLFRVNAAAHSERSFQDNGFFKTYAVASSLTFKLSDRLTINVDGEFYGRNGTTAFANTVRYATVSAKSADELGLDYKRSYTNNSILAETKATNLFAEINYKIDEQWVSQTNLSFASCKFEYPAVNVVTLNDSMLYRNVRYQYTHQNTNQVQQNFIGTFFIGDLKNKLLVGVDAQYGRFDFPNTKDFAFDTINYLNPGKKYIEFTIDDIKARLAGKSNAGSRSGNESVGAYVSDVLSLTDRLSVMASLRFEWYKSIGTYLYSTDAVTGAFEQNSLSPKFGAVYQLVKNQVSVFANYMNGYSPTSGTDFTGNSFVPQYANQAEGGVKADLLNGRLTATVSYYDIMVTNTLRTDPDHAGFSIQDGTQKSRGVEVDVVSNPLPGLNIVAGYAYNDSKLVKANENVAGKRPTSSGAYNIANAWLSYKFRQTALKGLGLGVGGNYSGAQYISNTTTAVFIIPEFTTIDATIFYDLKSIRFAAKVDNITSERYWAQSTLAPMPPARFSFNCTVKF